MKFTRRDKEIIACLASCLRVLSAKQIASTWWSESTTGVDSALRRMRTLATADWLQELRIPVDTLPAMAQPVVTWSPGAKEPDVAAAAWQLQNRWERKFATTSLFLATRSAAKVFGGVATGQLKSSDQATHDLGVAEIYLQIRKFRPRLLQWWVGEDTLAPHRRGQKLPDAVIASRPGATPQLVLEFGGAYDKARLREFHEDCSQRALPYEIW
ncbi:MAG: hypothetical protein ACE361_26205 [Aureliella sp.]